MLTYDTYTGDNDFCACPAIARRFTEGRRRIGFCFVELLNFHKKIDVKSRPLAGFLSAIYYF